MASRRAWRSFSRPLSACLNARRRDELRKSGSHQAPGGPVWSGKIDGHTRQRRKPTALSLCRDGNPRRSELRRPLAGVALKIPSIRARRRSHVGGAGEIEERETGIVGAGYRRRADASGITDREGEALRSFSLAVQSSRFKVQLGKTRFEPTEYLERSVRLFASQPFDEPRIL